MIRAIVFCSAGMLRVASANSTRNVAGVVSLGDLTTCIRTAGACKDSFVTHATPLIVSTVLHFEVARAAASLQKHAPQDIRAYFSRRFCVRISIHRAVQHYLAITGIPTLTLQLCGFLDFRSATRPVTTDSINASARGEVFLHADIFTPYYDPSSFTFLEGL